MCASVRNATVGFLMTYFLIPERDSTWSEASRTPTVIDLKHTGETSQTHLAHVNKSL